MAKRKQIEVIEEPSSEMTEQTIETIPQEQDISADEKETKKELELIKTWKERCDEIARSLDVAKDNRSHWQGECSKLQKAFDAAYNKGWQALTNEAPLLDIPGVDPDEWRNTLINDADMKESLKNKVAEHFATLGELADWINLAFPPKKKGLGPKVHDEIAEWFDKFHEAAMFAERARVQVAKEMAEEADATDDDEEDSAEFEDEDENE